MPLPRGAAANNSGIDPEGTTFITEIQKVKERIGVEALDDDGAFQEAAAIRHKITHTLKGYGVPSAVPGLNGLTEVDDGPFIDSVQVEEDQEQLDVFEVVGHEYSA